MKVLICDKVNEIAISILRDNNFDVDYRSEITPVELLKSIFSCHALIVRSRTKVTKEVINQAVNLKLIARAGSGTDNIDKETAKSRGIAVINAPGANAQAVAELTLGLMLSLIRQIPYADSALKKGLWAKKELIGTELHGKKVGIIGYGNVGKIVANLVRAFGTEVINCTSHDNDKKLIELLRDSDFVCLHVRLNDKTRGLMNKERLSLMKKTAYLINSARGEIVVEDDLYASLKNKQIAGAALDVYWREPLEKDSRWLSIQNVILTPHIGGQTKEATFNACKIVANDILKYFKGEVINSRVV